MSTRNYTNVIFGKFRLLCVDSSPCSNWSQTLLNSPSYWLTVTLLTFLVMRGLACYHGTPLYLSVSEIMKSSESNVAQCCHSRPPALTGDQVLRARPAKWQSSGGTLGTPATGAQERGTRERAITEPGDTGHHEDWWHQFITSSIWILREKKMFLYFILWLNVDKVDPDPSYVALLTLQVTVVGAAGPYWPQNYIHLN